MSVLGWWFSRRRVLSHGDGRRITIGRTHEVTGHIRPCKKGLHMSRDILDALRYATGPILWRVRGSGDIVELGDKLACSRRTYIAGGIDCSEMLRRFACRCALDVIHIWDAPPVVRRYLRTCDDSVRADAMYAVDVVWSRSGNAWGAAYWAASHSGDVATDARESVFCARHAAWYARRASKAAVATKITQSHRLHRMALAAIKPTRRQP